MKLFFKSLIFILPLLILSISLFDVLTAYGNSVTLPNPLGQTSSIYDLIKKIVDWLVEIGGIIAVGMIIWGAIQMIFAGGDPEKFSKGKKTIFYTIIGYAIILIGWGIETIIKKFFGSS